MTQRSLAHAFPSIGSLHGHRLGFDTQETTQTRTPAAQTAQSAVVRILEPSYPHVAARLKACGHSGQTIGGRYQLFKCHQSCCVHCRGRRRHSRRYIQAAEPLLTRPRTSIELLLLTTPPTPVGEIGASVGKLWLALGQLLGMAALRLGRLARSTSIEIKPTDGDPEHAHVHAHIWQAADQDARPMTAEEVELSIAGPWKRATGGRAGCQDADDPVASLVYTLKGHYDPALFLANPARFLTLYQQTNNLTLHSVSGAFRNVAK